MQLKEIEETEDDDTTLDENADLSPVVKEKIVESEFSSDVATRYRQEEEEAAEEQAEEKDDMDELEPNEADLFEGDEE